MSEGELLLPFPGGVAREDVRDATHFKSTWLSFSLRTLREHQLIDRYFAALPPEDHQEIRSLVAGSWQPARLAVVHYATCDKLQVPEAMIVHMGRQSSVGVHGAIFKAMVRLAKEAGATPWTGLASAHAEWARSWRGAGVAIYKEGPKDARIKFAGYPFAPIPYVRVGLRGVIFGILEMFSARSYVTAVPELCGERTLGYRVSWV